MRAAFADVAGVRTRYLHAGESGEAPPLLLVHGFGGGGDAWIRNIDALASGRRVFAPDLVGHGHTDPVDLRGEPPHGPTLSHLSAWIDDMGWERFDVVGSSFGALITALLWFARPESIRRVVLVGSAACFETEDELRRAIERAGATSLSDRAHRTLAECRRAWEQAVVDPTCIPEAVVLRHLTTHATPGMAEYHRQAIAGMWHVERLRPYRVLDRLEAFAPPTLVVWGREDHGARWQSGKEASRRLPDGRFVLFEACGHLPYLEHPRRFNDLVDRFLRDPSFHEASDKSLSTPEKGAR